MDDSDSLGSSSSTSSSGDLVIQPSPCDDTGLVLLEVDAISPFACQRFAVCMERYREHIGRSCPLLLNGFNICFDIPSSFLPLALSVVFGFNVHKTMLHVELELTDLEWTKRPKISFSHPVLGTNFTGKGIIVETISRFFMMEFVPKENYRCERYIEGLRRNVSYIDCQLLYLVLELTDAFMDMSDHCCMCSEPIRRGIKPAVCSKELCWYSFAERGVGNSLVHEIKRDTQAADLLFSMFAAAFNTQYCEPRPPFAIGNPNHIFQTLPAMTQLGQCQNDKELRSMIGDDSFNLLRWVLFSNRSHLISQPGIDLNASINAQVFMTLLASPESEEVFNRLKEVYGSCFLWHGSHGDRWHTILRNGLKNVSGTALQANGAALGPGIYFAPASQTSFGYVRPAANPYQRSSLGPSLNVIALCEVAKIPDGRIMLNARRPGEHSLELNGFLRSHGWAYTLTVDQACVVRFLFVGGTSFSVDTIANHPRSIPTLESVMQSLSNKHNRH